MHFPPSQLTAPSGQVAGEEVERSSSLLLIAQEGNQGLSLQ